MTCHCTYGCVLITRKHYITSQLCRDRATGGIFEVAVSLGLCLDIAVPALISRAVRTEPFLPKLTRFSQLTHFAPLVSREHPTHPNKKRHLRLKGAHWKGTCDLIMNPQRSNCKSTNTPMVMSPIVQEQAYLTVHGTCADSNFQKSKSTQHSWTMTSSSAWLS